MIELILRAGEAALGGVRGDLGALQKAVDATADLDPLPPRLNAVRLTAVKLLEAAPPARPGWCETLSGHLRDLDEGTQTGRAVDPALVAAWHERGDLQ